MRPLAALLLLLLATEPTEPATRSELAEKKMSELVATMQRLEAPQHEIDGCFDGDDPTQAALERRVGGRATRGHAGRNARSPPAAMFPAHGLRGIALASCSRSAVEAAVDGGQRAARISAGPRSAEATWLLLVCWHSPQAYIVAAAFGRDLRQPDP